MKNWFTVRIESYTKSIFTVTIVYYQVLILTFYKTRVNHGDFKIKEVISVTHLDKSYASKVSTDNALKSVSNLQKSNI